MADVLYPQQNSDMDPRWNGQWMNRDQPPMDSAFPAWNTDESRTSYAPTTDFTHGGFPHVNPEGRMYGVLQPFSNPTSGTVQTDTSETTQSSQTPLIQSPHGSLRRLHSLSPSGPSEAATGELGLPQNFQFNAQYTPLSNTPQIYGPPSILPSSPLLDSQTTRRSHTVPQTDTRPRNLYEPVARTPEMIAGGKRRRSFEGRRSKEGLVVDDLQPQPELSDEEKLLIKLKQEQNMPWKDISKEFGERLGRPYQVPALQMRYKRLKERLRTWSDQDVAALQAAYNYWENNKFEIIGQKMLDFGVQDKWPAKMVEKKWEQLQDEQHRLPTLQHSNSMPTHSRNLGLNPPQSTFDSLPTTMPDQRAILTAGGLHFGYDPEWTTRIMEARQPQSERREMPD